MSVTARDGLPAHRRFRILASALPAAALLLGAPATAGEHWLELFAAERGAPVTAFKPMVKVGPFPRLLDCYASAGLSIDELNDGHPDRDFLARCEGGAPLDLGQIIDRFDAERARAASAKEPRS